MKRFLGSKKGMSSLELVIGILILLFVFSFLVDITGLAWKYLSVSQINNQFARVAGYQGGVLSTRPDGFPGHYYTDSEMRTAIEDKLEQAGIVNFRISPEAFVQHDYKKTFSTYIEFDYKWELTSNYIHMFGVPGTFNLEQTMRSERPTISEWKYDYTIWDGE